MRQDPATVARRLIEEGFTDGTVAVCDEIVDAAFVEHQDFGPGQTSGPEGVKRVIASLHRAFSDFRLDIDHLAVQGDLVWLHMTGGGTNDGPFMGHPPSGRAMRIDVFDMVRVRDGRLVEHWGIPDRLGALFQLGLVAPPGPASA